MILSTARLILRPYRLQDEAPFTALNCDPQARKHMNGPLTREQAGQRFAACLASPDAWAVTARQGGGYLGHAFIVASQWPGDREVGFILDPAVWGRGYGTEVARALVRHGIGQYGRVLATVDADHRASIQVLRNAGMVLQSEENDEYGPYLVFASRG